MLNKYKILIFQDLATNNILQNENKCVTLQRFRRGVCENYVNLLIYL